MNKSIAGVLVLLLAGCGDSESSDSTGSGAASTGGSGSGGSATGGSGATGTGGSGATGTGGSGGNAPLPCGSVPTFEDGKTPLEEIHVAENGSDGGDGTAGNPYATIGRAAQDAVPGSAIVVHEGTYAGGDSIAQLHGSDAAPIWIGGAAGEARPVLQGGPNGIQLSQPRYVVVHDLEIEGSQFNGINCDDGADYANADAARHIVFRNLDIHDIGGTGNQDCLKLSGLNDYYVLDSSFARCGGGDSGSGIDHVGCHRGVIVGNSFDTMSGNGVQCKGGSDDIEIRRNHFVDAGHRAVNMGGSTGFEFFRPPLDPNGPNFEARDIRVVANIIEGGPSALAFVGCVDCLAANNTIVDPENWVFRILQESVTGGGYEFTAASGGQVVNNLVYFTAGLISTHVNVGGNTAPDTFSFTTNLWYAHDSPGQSTPNLPVAEQGGIVGSDPLLADPGNGDYDIDAASPAAGAGSAVTNLGGDFDGACFAMPPSIGAFEAAP